MNPTTEQDIHLIAAPFRFVRDWIRIILFILILPVVLVVNVIHWALTGQPIMSPDEIWLAKTLFILATPVWILIATMVIWRIAKRPKKEPESEPETVKVWSASPTEKLLTIAVPGLAILYLLYTFKDSLF